MIKRERGETGAETNNEGQAMANLLHNMLLVKPASETDWYEFQKNWGDVDSDTIAAFPSAKAIYQAVSQEPEKRFFLTRLIRGQGRSLF